MNDYGYGSNGYYLFQPTAACSKESFSESTSHSNGRKVKTILGNFDILKKCGNNDVDILSNDRRVKIILGYYEPWKKCGNNDVM